MSVSRLDLCAAAGLCTTVLFGGCAGGSAPLAPALPQGALARGGLGYARLPSVGDQHAWMVHPDRRPSRMRSGAKSAALLYVSDLRSSDVYVYSYPAGKLQGTLTGFKQPRGLCADKAGNVYVTDANAFRIREYAHGGTKPIATLKDPGRYPVACSSDPATGNLAVVNFSNKGTALGFGSIAIYAKAKGAPAIYADSAAIGNLYFGGYDDKSNLFVDGWGGPSSTFILAELPKGGKQFKLINLTAVSGTTPLFPGGVQWDGSYLAFGDSISNTIFQTKISGNAGKIVGITALVGTNPSTQTTGQFWKQGQRVIAADYSDGHVGFWKYPFGGKATKRISGLGLPYGVTISSPKAAK